MLSRAVRAAMPPLPLPAFATAVAATHTAPAVSGGSRQSPRGMRIASFSSILTSASSCSSSARPAPVGAFFSSAAGAEEADGSGAHETSPAFVVQHPPLDSRSGLTSGGGDSGDVDVATAADRAFAVVSFAGSQFKVTVDDLITVSTNVDADVGETVRLNDVLLVGSAGKTVVGRPLVPRAQVMLAVEEKKKEQKVIVFKKRRRKGYQRKNGFRRQVTALRVVDISY